MRSEFWRLGVVALLTIVLAAVAAVFLDYCKFRNSVESLTRARVNASAVEIERTVREALAVGLQFHALDGLPQQVALQHHNEPLIGFIDVADSAGRVVYSSESARVGQGVPAIWMSRASRAREGEWMERTDGGLVTGRVLRNAFDQPVGWVVIHYADPQQAPREQAFLARIVPLAAGLALLAGGAAVLGLVLMARRGVRLGRVAALVATGVPLALMLVALSALTLKQFEHALSPALAQWGRTFAADQAGLVARAQSLGVSADELYGVETHFREQVEAHPELGYLALFDVAGKPLGEVGSRPVEGVIEADVGAPGAVFARLALGIDPAFSRHQIQDLAIDLVVLLVVALFLAFELLGALERRVRSPKTATALWRIRAPAFVFFLAEELTRPVMPGLVTHLAPGKWVDPQFLAGAPIFLFMLIVALSQPILGAWMAERDRSRLMVLGAVLAVAGFVGCALATFVWQVMLARALGALGYAITFAASQAFVVDHSEPARRAQGFALLVGAIMVASVCGPPLGGILADNLGFSAPFVAAALLAVLAAVLASGLPRNQPAPALKAVSPLRALSVLGNPKFAMLCACAAVPAKMLLTGLAFYLLPLYAVALGGTQATAGRLLLLYAIVMVVLVPVYARLSDRMGRREAFVVGGLAVSTLGAGLVGWMPGLPALAVAMLVLGLGQSLSIAAQSALVGVFAQAEARTLGETAVYGTYRLIERLGNALGPVVAAALLAHFGFEGAFVGLSGLALGMAVVFFLFACRREGQLAKGRA